MVGAVEMDLKWKGVAASLQMGGLPGGSALRGFVSKNINNHLKSPEEIEADLYFNANATMGEKSMITDGYLYTHSFLNGTMEENY